MSEGDSPTVPIVIKNLGVGPSKGSIPCVQLLTGEHAGLVFALDELETIMGRDPLCHVQIDETGISRRHAKFTRAIGNIISLEDLGSTNGTYVAEERITHVHLNKGDIISFGGAILARFDLRPRYEIELARTMYETSTRDPLTRALKRDSFNIFLEERKAFLTRENGRFSLMLVEIDRYEHLAGTSIQDVGEVFLKQLADNLRKSIRLGDAVARYDHQVFAVYLHGVDGADAARVSKRIFDNIPNSEFVVTSGERKLAVSLTASAGGASWSAPASLEAVCSAAELRLREAQQHGGNQLVWP